MQSISIDYSIQAIEEKKEKKLCVLCVCVTDVMCIANNNGGESNF
jgi:hypothetical protein